MSLVYMRLLVANGIFIKFMTVYHRSREYLSRAIIILIENELYQYRPACSLRIPTITTEYRENINLQG